MTNDIAGLPAKAERKRRPFVHSIITRNQGSRMTWAEFDAEREALK